MSCDLLFPSVPHGLTPCINLFMHTLHTSRHHLQCNPHKTQLKRKKGSSCWLKPNIQFTDPSSCCRSTHQAFVSGPGEMSQSLCNKLSQSTTRIKIPESSVRHNIRQNPAMVQRLFRTSQLELTKSHNLNSEHRCAVTTLNRHQIHNTFRQISSADNRILCRI